MGNEIKRWTAKRKSAWTLDFIQGRPTVVEASSAYDLAPLEMVEWVDEVERGIENGLLTKRLEVKLRYERQLRELLEVYGEVVLDQRRRKYCHALFCNADEQ